ncbi:MAG: hypothetical protein R3343_06365 [Nitriliruptorales bacterium]|nr:hypothetical protein [Nitriliruptorales bacterium]
MPETPTVYLDQYLDENAEKIGKALDEADIVWWSKTSGRFVRAFFAGDWGTRIYVERDRLDEARAIAEDVLGS